VEALIIAFQWLLAADEVGLPSATKGGGKSPVIPSAVEGSAVSSDSRHSEIRQGNSRRHSDPEHREGEESLYFFFLPWDSQYSRASRESAFVLPARCLKIYQEPGAPGSRSVPGSNKPRLDASPRFCQAKSRACPEPSPKPGSRGICFFSDPCPARKPAVRPPRQRHADAELAKRKHPCIFFSPHCPECPIDTRVFGGESLPLARARSAIYPRHKSCHPERSRGICVFRPCFQQPPTCDSQDGLLLSLKSLDPARFDFRFGGFALYRLRSTASRSSGQDDASRQG
jgi:hypothetical protein